MIIIPSHAHLCGAKPTTGQSLWQTCSDFCYNWRFLSFFFIQLSSAARQCTIKLQWSCDRCCFFFFLFPGCFSLHPFPFQLPCKFLTRVVFPSRMFSSFRAHLSRCLVNKETGQPKKIQRLQKNPREP